MAYTATEEQKKLFAGDHEYLKKILDLGHEILWLTKDECIKAGPDLDETLAIIEKVLMDHGRKEYEMPAKIGIHPWSDVFFHAMPAYVPNSKACGIKWIECFPRNPKEFQLPQTTGLQIMNDIETGVPYAVMDCAWLTSMRTPAVTALTAAKFHPGAEYFGMFRLRRTGRGTCEIHSQNAEESEEDLYLRRVGGKQDQLIQEVKPYVDVPIEKSDPKTMASRCDVMASATIILLNSLSVVKKEWVSKGQTILPCDLNTFWDPAIQREADKYFVDSVDEHKLFESMGYFPEGLPRIQGETGEVLADLIPGRTSSDELIVVSNIGISVCDMVMGRAIFDKAVEMGLGRKLPL